MLLVGTNIVIKQVADYLSEKDKVYIVNLSSADLSVRGSPLFYAPRSSMESFNYDVEYANYIFQNTEQRISLLYMINQLLMGNHVLIMIGTYPGMYEMAESLLKLIQTKYGYNGYIINPGDIEYMYYEGLDMYQSRFSTQGLLLFDEEKTELDEIFLREEQRNYRYGNR